MKKTSSRREFLRAGAITGSLIVIPGAISRLTGSPVNSIPDEISSSQNLAEQPVSWFSSPGETIYHLKAGKTSNDGSRSIIAASFSGNVLCFDFAGNKLWEQDACKFFPFAMDVADVDGDGFDECVIASADGSLYIIDHDGKLIAKVFQNKPPLYAVKIVKDAQGNTAIYCGGPERILYKISQQGTILAQSSNTRAITNIASGNFLKTGGPGLVVGMQANYTTFNLIFYNLSNFSPVGAAINTKETYLYTMVTADLDTDVSDLLACGGNKDGVILDSNGTVLKTLTEKSTGRGQDTYTMVMLDSIPSASGQGRQLIGLCGPALRFYDASGSIQKEVVFDIAPAAMYYDDLTSTLLLGSDISGGDTIYVVRMKIPGWENSLKTLGYQGKLKTIENNIKTLSAQVDAFAAPVYQPAEKPELLCVFSYNPYNPGTASEINPATSLAPLTNFYTKEFPGVQFAGNQWLSENWDRSALPYGWATKRDTRMTYKFTSKEIIDYAKKLEDANLPFVWTIGHGNDPFFLSLTTVEGILLAAPNACKGFMIPEISVDTTTAYTYAVQNHIKPICDLCLKYGNRKMFLRSKFLFWVAECSSDTWKWMIEGKKYRDVIVPAMEETYERLCDLSISGRIGLQHGGWFKDWAGRAVHDNVCYTR